MLEDVVELVLVKVGTDIVLDMDGNVDGGVVVHVDDVVVVDLVIDIDEVVDCVKL